MDRFFFKRFNADKIISILFIILSFQAFAKQGNYITTELKWSHYLIEPANKHQLQNYTFARTKFNHVNHVNNFTFKATSLTEFSLDQSGQFYLNVPELYGSYMHTFSKISFLKHIRTSLGREIKSWSYVDEYFELGLWNSLNLWNPLYPKSNGLIGSFTDLVSNNWSLHLFLGGLFIPSLSVNIKQYKDKIYSRSRWFSGAPHAVEAFGQILDIDYWVHTPFITDVVFQESYIASLNLYLWTERKKNMWLKINAGYKPINQVILARNNDSSITIDATNKEDPVKVSQELFIFPVQHRLISLEWGFQEKNLSLFLSGGDNKIIEDPLPKGWDLVNRATGFSYFSSFLKYHFSFKNHLKNYLKLSYINLYPHDTKKEINVAKMSQGLGVDWKTELFYYRRKIADIEIRYWYSIPEKGGLLLANLTYNVSPLFYVQGTMDVLGVADMNKNTFSFLNRFRANDRVELKVGYVF